MEARERDMKKIISYAGRMSIRKKIFTYMMLVSVIPIILLAYFSLMISKNNMEDQLVQNKLTGMDWLSDKLTTELDTYSDTFYEAELDKEVRNAVNLWSLGLDYDDYKINDVRNSFDESLNKNANIKSIELYKFNSDTGYKATRTGFYENKSDTVLKIWNKRQSGLQNNIVVAKDGNDFLIMHQFNRFSNGKKMALLVVRLNKHAFSDAVAQEIPDGGEAFLFSDDGTLLFSLGNNSGNAMTDTIMGRFKESTQRYFLYKENFCFYENIKNGKMKLLCIIPDRLIYKQLRDNIKISVMILILAVTGTIILSFVLSEIVSKPISKLSKKMLVTDINNYSAENNAVRMDEIGILQESFDKMMRRNQELITREYQNELDRKNAQMRALQAQINPHFLYNTLQIIASMSLTDRTREIYSVTTALADIMRYAISFSEEEVTLQREINYLQSFIFIQNTRFENRILLEINMGEGMENTLIPKLVLQPLVENSLEHGLAQKKGMWKINVEAHAEYETGTLVITVLDNGEGMAEDELARVRDNLDNGSKALDSSRHIGLKNVDTRIKLFGGSDYGLEINSTEGQGTIVTMRTKLVFREGEKKE